jgi:hypothetical protein
MKKFYITAVVLTLVHASTSIKAQVTTSEIIPDEYIVTIKETAIASLLSERELPAEGTDRDAAKQQIDGTRQLKLNQLRTLRTGIGIPDGSILYQGVDAAVFFIAKLSPVQADALRQSPLVEQVENNIQFQLALPEPEPEESSPTPQKTPCAITNAGGSVDGSTKPTVIWIMDTGIDTDHPDLNVLTGNNAKSFVPNQTYDDGQGHGTHVAGIAAAKNNNFGTVGLSAGAKVVPIKVLSNTGSGSNTWIVQALDHIAQYCVAGDVVNMSFAGTVGSNCDNPLYSYINAVKALGNKGVWVCIAAGNDGCDASKVRPACFNGPKMFTVGNMTCSSKCASTSNWAKSVVDWVATGEKVYSTYKNNTYKTLSGTSMATPVVAGICHATNLAPKVAGTITCGNSCVVTATYNIAKR